MPNPMMIAEEVKRAFEEYTGVLKTRTTWSASREAKSWKAPRPGVIKVNCDTLWCRKTKNGGIDVIARN